MSRVRLCKDRLTTRQSAFHQTQHSVRRIAQEELRQLSLKTTAYQSGNQTVRFPVCFPGLADTSGMAGWAWFDGQPSVAAAYSCWLYASAWEEG